MGLYRMQRCRFLITIIITFTITTKFTITTTLTFTITFTRRWHREISSTDKIQNSGNQICGEPRASTAVSRAHDDD